MKIKIFWFIVLLFLWSCTKEIEIDIPQEEPSLVVHSSIVPFTMPVSKSLGIDLQSSLYIYDTTTLKIDDAIVLYYENDILRDTLEYSYDKKKYIIDKTISDFPVVGNKYSIEISKEGFTTVTAHTTIPSKVIITDTIVNQIAYYNEDGGAYSEVSVSFDDPSNEENYYEIAISDIGIADDNWENYYSISSNDNIITSENYYPSLIRFDIKKPKFLLFSDKQINGQAHQLSIFYTPPQRESDVRWITSHYISIHLRNVTEEYYKYRTTLLQHLNSNEEDILYGTGEPLNVVSNIENGLGFFAGYNTDIVSFKLDSLIVSK